MPREVMDRRAADNVYLHKDFHGALSGGIEYLHAHFGEEAVREYLRQFARSYYAPLIRAIEARGLEAIAEHYAQVYATEECPVEMTQTDDELILHVAASPAVEHMRAHDYPVARLFVETVRTVNAALCEGTPFAAELLEYDDATGRSVQRFYRRAS